MTRLLAAVAALLVAGSAVVAAALDAPAEPQTLHYTANLHGDYTGPVEVGFNLLDATPSTVDALPDGVQALVWVGQKCPTPADAAFRTAIDALADDPQVFGYYLSDEPHIVDCPDGAAALASRADYIAQTTDQYSFILLSRADDYSAFRPELSHVDLVGLDPYPCSVSHPECALDKIDQRVNAALDAGVPLDAIVPVYQAFGQENTAEPYYQLPTADQLRAMLERWQTLVPDPVFDYAYSWGNQSSSNPTLVDSPELRQVLADWFASTEPTPEPTPEPTSDPTVEVWLNGRLSCPVVATPAPGQQITCTYQAEE